MKIKKTINADKIGLLSSSFLPNCGGAEIGLHNLAVNLIKYGYEPIVFTSWLHKNKLEKEAWNLPYKVVSFPPKFLTMIEKYPKTFLYLNYLLLNYWKSKYGISIWHGVFSFPIGVILGYNYSKVKFPFLIRAVGEDIQISRGINYGMRINPIVNKLIKTFLLNATTFVASTKTVLKEYKKLKIDLKKIKLIPNGINLSYLQNFKDKKLLKYDLGISCNDFVFLCFGRYHRKKNFSSVLKAAVLLKKQKIKNFSIIIGGKGVSYLKEEVKKLNLLDTVYLYEPNTKNKEDKLINLPSTDVLRAYYSSDCFVMPSKIETFGIVTIEAMAFGLPVIISKAPGNIDVVRNGKDGIMYDNDAHSKNLAFYMKKILIDKNFYNEYKKKSLIRVKNFDWTNLVKEYLVIYEDIVKNKL